MTGDTAARPSPVAPDGEAREPAIVVDHVWKAFRPRTHQVSLRHEAMKLVKDPFRREANPEAPFWALRDVTFSMCHGESVALVGRNGSGKTTLLRVLSGITRPTRGSVRVGGRFATLIGLGAGFNLERTGRENIYLNAAIQGVPPRKVGGFLDEIIAFADIGEFMDVPVKRYSSGMIARLGFSIAIHIFPDIIFIDEVLAVGDAAFQEKCAERILEMKREGRTILFVSHAAETVRQLCERAVWLHHGEVRFDGPTDEALARYDATLHEEMPSTG